MRESRPYLQYILQSIASIEELAAAGEKALLAPQSKHNRAAIIYYLHTLAEATQRLPDSLKAEYPEIDWEGIGGFRNRLVHGYLEVNFDIVWNVIIDYLPSLKTAVEAMSK